MEDKTMSLRKRIKDLEAQGYTGRTNAELHRLNCQQTDAIPTDQLERDIETRRIQGKPHDKLLAARRRRR